MQKEKRTLIQAIQKCYPEETIDLKIREFFSTLGDNPIPWLEIRGQIFFMVSYISLGLNKHRTDFAANWMSKEHRRKTLPGISVQFEGDELKTVQKMVKSLYPKQVIGPKTWFADWEMISAYVSRSANRIHLDNPQKDRDNSSLSVVLHKGILYLDSLIIAKQLGTTHHLLLDVITNHKTSLDSLGSLKMKEKTDPSRDKTSFLLNEDQAYFIATVLPNTPNPIQYKRWLVTQFTKARSISHKYYHSLDTEEVIQKELLELTLHTPIKAYSEYPLPLRIHTQNGLFKTSIKRVDIFLDKSVAIEIKKDKITLSMVTSVIGTKGYYHSLKKIPTFKYLILSSPSGITETAEQMIQAMHPNVIFKYPTEIAEQLVKQVLEHYPKKAHWWVKNHLLPQFPNILTKELLESLSLNEPQSEELEEL